MSKKISWYLSLTLVFVILGFLLSTQFQTQQKVLSALDAQRKEDLITVWKSLDDKRLLLEQEVNDLDSSYRQLLQESEEDNSTLKAISNDMKKLRLVSGITAVTGPGVTITITGDSPLYFLDLIDLTNELWATGAEAIAINEHRIVEQTAISEASDAFSFYITIDGEKLLYPIVVKAIGEPHTLEKGLTFTGGLVDIWKTQFSIHPEVQQRQELNIAASQSFPIWRFANVATSQ